MEVDLRDLARLADRSMEKSTSIGTGGSGRSGSIGGHNYLAIPTGTNQVVARLTGKQMGFPVFTGSVVNPNNENTKQSFYVKSPSFAALETNSSENFFGGYLFGFGPLAGLTLFPPIAGMVDTAEAVDDTTYLIGLVAPLDSIPQAGQPITLFIPPYYAWQEQQLVNGLFVDNPSGLFFDFLNTASTAGPAYEANELATLYQLIPGYVNPLSANGENVSIIGVPNQPDLSGEIVALTPTGGINTWFTLPEYQFAFDYSAARALAVNDYAAGNDSASVPFTPLSLNGYFTTLWGATYGNGSFVYNAGVYELTTTWTQGTQSGPIKFFFVPPPISERLPVSPLGALFTDTGFYGFGAYQTEGFTLSPLAASYLCTFSLGQQQPGTAPATPPYPNNYGAFRLVIR